MEHGMRATLRNVGLAKGKGQLKEALGQRRMPKDF